MNATERARSEIRAALAELRRTERDDAAKRLAAARSDLNFAQAERALARAQINIAVARVKRTADFGKLNTDLKEAQTAYDEALRRTGVDINVHFRCDKCLDEGFDRDGKPCECIKDDYIALLKKYCGADNIPPFTFEDDLSRQLGCSQSEDLAFLYAQLKNFCDNFDRSHVKVIFLCGKPGIGKSSLAYATANELLSKGRSVCFMTAFEFNNAMLRYHTSPIASRAAIMEPVTDSDLLVIDDLGTENVLRNVTCEYLYNVIDTRISHGRPLLVTSNLDPESLMNRYGERTVSRMLNKAYSKAYMIDGDNLRLQGKR